MKLPFQILILFCSAEVYSQRLEITAGGIRNAFLAPGAPFEKRTPGYGIFVQANYVSDSANFLPLRNIYLSLQQYSAGIVGHSTSYAGSFKTGCDLSVKRTTLSLGLYPVALKFFQKRLRLDIGMEAGYLLYHKTEGSVFFTRKMDSIPPNYNGPGYYQVEEKWSGNMQGFHNNFTLGACGSLTCILAKTQNFQLVANYSFYYGLMVDLNPYIGVRSQRQRFGMGLAIPLRSAK